MLARFCLYGFLKNQQYWVPFLLLCFRAKGLSFTEIGFLVSFRELAVNLLEIPSGALADLHGRRRAMLFSFAAYVLSFALLGGARSFAALALAMACFGVGDAFRSGTHKAMIMSWLEARGRLDERTKIYGLTRSWSRLGSALSALIAAGLVFWTRDYEAIFWWSIPPYLLGMANLFGYPAELDGHGHEKGDGATPPRPGLVAFMRSRASEIAGSRALRRALVETMLADGYHGASKDYLQPLLKAAALALPLGLTLDPVPRAALLVGGVYFALHLLESLASRKAHLLSPAEGDDEASARRIWRIRALMHALLAVALLCGTTWPPILLFVALGVLQNLWRPLQVGRVQSLGRKEGRATLLSVESQGKAVATMFLAPALGFAVDHVGLLAVGLAGLALSLLPLVASALPPSRQHGYTGDEKAGGTVTP